MHLHGAHADAQLIGDEFVGAAAGHQAHHVAFALGQLVGAGAHGALHRQLRHALARNGQRLLVAVDQGDTVVGYASFGDWRPFDGYRHTVEHSVYVRSDQRGGGIGRALMLTLIERARGLGKHVMVAGVEAGNEGSLRLHELLGFEHAGTLRQVGTKFGAWLDLTFLQLTLDDRARP